MDVDKCASYVCHQCKYVDFKTTDEGVKIKKYENAYTTDLID